MDEKNIFAVASFGGHWVQLNKLDKVLQRHNTYYFSTEKNIISNKTFYINDFSRDDFWKAIPCFFKALYFILKLKPHVVISTGALPGLIFIVVAKLCRKKTVWLDSMANSDELSFSGKFAGKFADVWLTQWEDLASSTGPFYKGRVI